MDSYGMVHIVGTRNQMFLVMYIIQGLLYVTVNTNLLSRLILYRSKTYMAKD